MFQVLHVPLEIVAAALLAGVLEGIGVPWPGMLIMAGAGAGIRSGWGVLALVAGLFSVTYALGSALQYTFGRLVGPLALSWLPAAQRKKLTNLTDRHGPLAVLWLRPLAVGNYVSIPAGMMRMPIPRFLLFTVLGIWPWAFGMMAAGRYFGDQFDADLVSAWMLPAVAVLGGLSILFALFRSWRNRHLATETTDGDEEKTGLLSCGD